MQQSQPTGGDAFVPRRRRLSDERKAITHKFHVGTTCEGYITVGLYEDGQPGEIFVVLSKEGAEISGLVDSFATAISIGLQYGVPLKVLVNKYVHAKYEPAGATQNPNIPHAKSIVDYIFRWLAIKFLSRQSQLAVGVNATEGGSEEVVGEVEEVDVATIIDGKTDDVPQATLFETKSDAAVSTAHTQTFDNQSDAPACDTCGSMMVRNAACYKCLNCGATSGCS